MRKAVSVSLIWSLLLVLNVSFVPAQADTMIKSYKERAYLAQRGDITMCVDPDWMPYEKIDHLGKHVGIAADYMAMFANLIGKKIQLIPTKTWSESEQFARARKCDIMSLLNKTEIRSEFLNFTEPYLQAAVVLIAKNEVPFIDGLQGLKGKTLGIVKDYVYESVIREKYPDIKISYVKTVDDGFRQVSDGKIFASIGSLYIATNRIRDLGLANLKIAGSAEFRHQLRVGVRNDDPVLLGLFQRAVENIDLKKENEILRRWMSVRIEKVTDHTLLLQVLGAAAIIFLLLFYRHMSIKQLNAELNESNELLKQRTEELQQLSRTDTLTQLNNRLFLDERLKEECQRFDRYKTALSCVIIDVDFFKEVNDQHGHTGGDAVLKALAEFLKTHIRASDILGRWGGEEFMIICPETDQNGAHKLAEHMRENIQNHRFDYAHALTCSFGVSSMRPGDSGSSLISRADMALYKAKEQRNKVSLG